jgi:hypothetical protein
MTIAIGFVGTKRGMTTMQRARVELLLRQLVKRGTLTAHQGDHLGADCYFGGARAIVAESDLLIACPKEPMTEGRRGTWGVVWYARAKGKRVIVIRPDGVSDA